MRLLKVFSLLLILVSALVAVRTVEAQESSLSGGVRFESAKDLQLTKNVVGGFAELNIKPADPLTVQVRGVLQKDGERYNLNGTAVARVYPFKFAFAGAGIAAAQGVYADADTATFNGLLQAGLNFNETVIPSYSHYFKDWKSIKNVSGDVIAVDIYLPVSRRLRIKGRGEYGNFRFDRQARRVSGGSYTAEAGLTYVLRL